MKKNLQEAKMEKNTSIALTNQEIKSEATKNEATNSETTAQSGGSEEIKKTKEGPTGITLACGGGGGSLGMKYAGCNELLAVDYWDVAKKVFEHNFKGEHYVPFHQADLLNISGQEILDMVSKKQGEIDILLASPPCPGLSRANSKRSPLDERNSVFLACIKLISEIRPKCFIIENVPGLQDDKCIAIFNEIKRRLKALSKYYNIKCFKLKALNYNTPQLRYRIFIIGYLKDFGLTPTKPSPDYESAKKLRIVDIAPEIAAVEVGQSVKKIKLNTAYMSTMTASQEMTVYSEGKKQTLTENQQKQFSTFPDWYSFPKGISKTDKQTIFGNIIPPMFMKAIVEHIKSELGDFL